MLPLELKSRAVEMQKATAYIEDSEDEVLDVKI